MTRLIVPSAVAALLTAALVTAPPVAPADYKHGMLTTGKLVKHASDYYGKTVTVKAKVDDVMGTNMFSLDEDALFAGPDVLVIVPAGVSNVAHDQKVVVTGEVRAYVEPDLDKDFSFFEDGKLIKKDTKIDWKTRPVIVATSVRTEDGTEIASSR
jgi:hypothetical protein